MKLLFTTVLLPPGIALVFALFALFYFKRAVAGRVFLILSIGLGWMFSTEATGRYLSSVLIQEVHRQANTHKGVGLDDIEMIVVPMGGMFFGGKSVGWLPKEDSYRRGLVALELQGKIGSRVPVLFSGGKTAGLGAPSEAQVLNAQFMRTRSQITPVILEEKSTNTYENALQTVSILQARNVEYIFLVTSEVHMLRALSVFRGLGINPVPFPVYEVDRRETTWKDFLPTFHGVKTTSRALYEILGIVKYLMEGYASWDDVFYR